MLRLAAIAAIGALSAAASAQVVISLARDHPAAASTAAPEFASAQVSDAAPASGQDAEVPKSPDGHYWAEASVSGHEVRFLVDTGASAVALTPEDAQRLGIDPNSLTYGYTVTTASGHAPAARVQLASIAVAGAEVDNVDAYVIQNGLEHSLLGMSYLGRLSQFEATKSSLILRP
ncbi:MAG TPA: TIGR02281 family clan AA aspartic protease [Caulobacteraceae bacterium]|nr:TIGR02281 family clan AA aspartic protease [Caulobacteraceae bacterium]